MSGRKVKPALPVPGPSGFRKRGSQQAGLRAADKDELVSDNGISSQFVLLPVFRRMCRTYYLFQDTNFGRHPPGIDTKYNLRQAKVTSFEYNACTSG